MLTDAYKRLVNMLRGNNGLAPLYPAPGVASSPPPLAAEVIDADEDERSQNTEDAAELMRGVIKDINGEGVDAGDDDEVDEYAALGPNARVVRHLLAAHYQSKFENVDADREKAATEAKRVADAASFIRACASTMVVKK